jgi:hypothetical protein
MIHHISIDAHDPCRVAKVLAEIWQGKVYQFLIPGSYLVMPFDDHGTHIVVFKSGDVWIPGTEAEAAKVCPMPPADFVSAHVAMSVPIDHEQIEQIGQREGWRVLTRHKGDATPFSATEFWVENRFLVEFFSPEFASQYQQAMQPASIAQILSQPIDFAPV